MRRACCIRSALWPPTIMPIYWLGPATRYHPEHTALLRGKGKEQVGPSR